MTTANNFAAMGKTELRAACKENGIKYGKLDNQGMRDALVAATTPAAPVNTAIANGWGQLAAGSAVPDAPKPANVVKVVDGKRIDPLAPKPKTERAPRNKPDAPIVPRVSRKGYTIQKEREERNGVKRPSFGTVCEAVWSMFDAMHESKAGLKAGDLPALADEHGWNRTNVSCEYYAWRKFMGIKGRATK